MWVWRRLAVDFFFGVNAPRMVLIWERKGEEKRVGVLAKLRIKRRKRKREIRTLEITSVIIVLWDARSSKSDFSRKAFVNQALFLVHKNVTWQISFAFYLLHTVIALATSQSISKLSLWNIVGPIDVVLASCDYFFFFSFDDNSLKTRLKLFHFNIVYDNDYYY